MKNQEETLGKLQFIGIDPSLDSFLLHEEVRHKAERLKARLVGIKVPSKS